MSETPSHRRRCGANAYFRGGNPEALNPYYTSAHKRADWREGWDRAEAVDKIRQAEEARISQLEECPIDLAIDMTDASDDVKMILKRIAEHVGMT